MSVFVTFFTEHAYHHVLILLYKPNATVLLMSLRVKMMKHNSIKNQCYSDSDDSVSANYESSSGLDQRTNHHCNTDSKNNDDSQSYEKPKKNSIPSLLVIKSPPQPHHDRPHCLHLENNIFVSKWKGKVTMKHNVIFKSINQSSESNISH